MRLGAGARRSCASGAGAALTGAARAAGAARRPCRRGCPVVYAAVPYGDEVRAVLLAHKERGALRLAPPLGGAAGRGGATAVCAGRPCGHGAGR